MTPTPETPKPEKSGYHSVPIDNIIEDPYFQVRGMIQPERVDRYAAAIQELGALDPMDVFYTEPLTTEVKITSDTKFYLGDGFHRLAAYRKVGGFEKVPCLIRIGSRVEALKYSLRKNGHHGMPPTNAEKRNMAERAVLEPEVGEMTDLQIAQLIGVSPSLVALCRRGETKSQTTKKARERKGGSSGGGGQPLVPVMAHERRKPGTAQITGPMALKEIESWLNDELISEEEILDMLKTANAAYVLVPRPGESVNLKVVSRSGKDMFLGPMVVKSIGLSEIVLVNEKGKKAGAMDS